MASFTENPQFFMEVEKMESPAEINLPPRGFGVFQPGMNMFANSVIFTNTSAAQLTFFNIIVSAKTNNERF